ncbi:MAG: 4Fe-4S dicluster domain-containing protein [Phycisphaerae bacterium]|jgi:nitrate reductase beta subunit|nr:4Fe-4S dicluster domain-containing protein [Phycisphaerae bacterium]MCZ2401386.1 4Fe-4S dicluster domain-containing protein [Phycisphaerae bacterium]NUQ47049.1 4Fe-4S dicluster domain-containing protein [Phycisphaerae bacterium]
MPDVHNWQLGRTMSYPFAAAPAKWQFAFVFNTNRCINCQTCTMACRSTWTFSKGQENIWWNNVETKPFGGYPQNWDSKLLALLEEYNPGGQLWDPAAGKSPEAPYGRFEGKTIFEAAASYAGTDGPKVALGYIPTAEEWAAPNIFEDHARPEARPPSAVKHMVAALPEHKVWFFYLARLCNHCTYPGCLAACPRQAIYKRPEDGVVLIDQSRCNGYQKCVEACPYKKSIFRPNTGTSEKCVACYPRLEGRDPELSPNGEPCETRCMTACVGKIRMQGLVRIEEDGAWAKDPQNPIYYLVRERQVALPLYPQFGTEPNGFYIPPRWVPRPYLIQMFGPGVGHAIEQYSCPDRELLAVLQLFRTAQQIIFRFEIQPGPKIAEIEVTMPDGSSRAQAIFNDTVIGYNKFDQEAVRITIEEPIFERPAIHANSI